jgi:cysteine synthase A
MIFDDITATVGHTPLVRLRNLGQGLPGKLVAKLESRNPTGSIKDRVAVAMVNDAEARGILKAGALIVEATSGNTGIGLAFVAAARGYRLALTMPETMSEERRALLRLLGAEVVLTPGSLMRDAVERARELVATTPGAVSLDQFRNPANPAIHRETTALEIWNDSAGQVDIFVAGVGTGGTVSGVGEVLKQKKPSAIIIAVEPQKAAVLSGGTPRNHVIQGIGAGFIPPILRRDLLDEVITVTEDEAFEYARRLAREEGIQAGISSGASLAAALRVAERPASAGKLIVFMVCDTAERYMNSPLMKGLIAAPPPRP